MTSLRITASPAFALLSLLCFPLACSSDESTESAPCTIAEHDGQAVLTCGDDSVLLNGVAMGDVDSPATGAGGRLANGATGEPPCSLSESATHLTLECGDTQTSVEKVAARAAGGAGSQLPGSGCSLSVESGETMLSCGERSVMIPSEGTVAEGACTIEETAPGYSTITCPDGSSAGLSTCQGVDEYCEGERAYFCTASGWEFTQCSPGAPCEVGERSDSADDAYCLGGFGGAGGSGE